MSRCNLGVPRKWELARASYQKTPFEDIDHCILCRIHMPVMANRPLLSRLPSDFTVHVPYILFHSGAISRNLPLRFFAQFIEHVKLKGI